MHARLEACSLESWSFFNQSQKRNSLDLSGLLLWYKYTNDVVITIIPNMINDDQ